MAKILTDEQVAARRAASRLRYANNREQEIARYTAYRAANTEKVKATRAAYSGQNLEKLAAAQRDYRAANPASVAASAKRSYDSNREAILAAKKIYTATNADKIAERNSEQYTKNRAARLAYARDYLKLYPERVALCAARYRAAKIERTASWDDELTDLVVTEAFDLARLRADATGMKWHVDHVVPLQGKKVSGLHVWNNIAVIPAVSNLKKSNRFAVA